MKRRQTILKSLSALGLISIFSLGCGTKTEGAKSTTAQTAAKDETPKAQQSLDAKSQAKEKVTELTLELEETQRDLQTKEAELITTKSNLNTLEDSDINERDYESLGLQKAEETKTRLMKDLQNARNKFGVDAQTVKENYVLAATANIEMAEQEFENLPEFGETNVVGEVLLYTLGLKFLWGAFTKYRTTLFTYKPELSQNLREKLFEMSEKLTKAQNALEASLADKSYAAITEDLTMAQEAVEEALAFFAKNTSALESKVVKTTNQAFNEQKLLLAGIQKYIPANQLALENTKADIAKTQVTQGNRTAEINKTKNKIEQLSSAINALKAQQRQKTANLNQAKADLAKLK